MHVEDCLKMMKFHHHHQLFTMPRRPRYVRARIKNLSRPSLWTVASVSGDVITNAFVMAKPTDVFDTEKLNETSIQVKTPFTSKFWHNQNDHTPTPESAPTIVPVSGGPEVSQLTLATQLYPDDFTEWQWLAKIVQRCHCQVTWSGKHACFAGLSVNNQQKVITSSISPLYLLTVPQMEPPTAPFFGPMLQNTFSSSDFQYRICDLTSLVYFITSNFTPCSCSCTTWYLHDEAAVEGLSSKLNFRCTTCQSEQVANQRVSG